MPGELGERSLPPTEVAIAAILASSLWVIRNPFLAPTRVTFIQPTEVATAQTAASREAAHQFSLGPTASEGRLRVTSVELGPSVTFPLSPPEADVGADIILRRLVPMD